MGERLAKGYANGLYAQRFVRDQLLVSEVAMSREALPERLPNRSADVAWTFLTGICCSERT